MRRSRAYNSGSIEALLELYEPDALVVGQQGPLLRGLAQIRTELMGLLALGGKIEGTNRYALTFENVALLSAGWKLTSTAPGGTPLLIEGRSAEIIRRQPDGRWLYIVDHPFGA